MRSPATSHQTTTTQRAAGNEATKAETSFPEHSEGRPRGRRFSKTAVAFQILAIFSASEAVVAQESSAQLQLESTTLEVGEAVDGQLILTNTGEPEPPTLTAPPGLDVRFTNPTPSQSSQISIINGRRSQRVTYIYSLRVTAQKEGVYTLGPIVISAGGASLQTNALNITVKPTSTAALALGDQYMFAKIDVTPTSLYVTQSFTAKLTIGIRKVEIDGRVTDVGSLLQFVDGGASDLSVFGTRFSSSEMSLNDSAGVRHPYALYQTSTEIRAEEIGIYQVGPVFFKMNYPLALRRGFFNSIEASRSRKETARAPVVEVQIKGAPDQGRPADFGGAIGRYAFKVDVKPTRVEQGRPFTLSLSISGSPLSGVAGPDLAKYPELVSRFDFASDELTGDTEGGAKVFRRAIFPKQQGEQTIPALSWSYFDPATERYVTLTSEPIAVTVDPPAPGSSPLPNLSELNGRNGERKSLTLVTGGIAPNYVDPAEVLADHTAALDPIETAGWLGGPPVLWLGVTLVTRHRRRLRLDSGFARARSAKRAAADRINLALRQSDPALQWTGLAHALTGFVSDRLNLPPGEMTPAEFRDALRPRGLDPAVLDEMTDFLDRCDAARYAPGAVGDSSPAQMKDRLRTWFDRIERGVR